MNTLVSSAVGGPIPIAARPAVAFPTSSASVAGAPPAPSRDAAVVDLAAITSSVNLLAQAASAGDPSMQLTLPPLPPTPAPAPAAAVPTDDHGTSNVVFAAPDESGDLIH